MLVGERNRGDRPTALAAIAQLMRVARSVNLARNSIEEADLEAELGAGMAAGSTIMQLNLSFNRLGAKGLT